VVTSAVAQPLAISDDNQYLYAGMVTSGTGIVARYRLPDFTADTSTILTQSTVPYRALNAAVQPGHAGTIAVLAERMDSTPGKYIAVFDDGIQRGAIIGGTQSDNPRSGVFWSPVGDAVISFYGSVSSGIAATYADIDSFSVDSSGFFNSTGSQYA